MQQDILEKRIRPVSRSKRPDSDAQSPFLALVPVASQGRRTSLDPFGGRKYEATSVLGKVETPYAAAPFAWHTALAPDEPSGARPQQETASKQRKRASREKKPHGARRWRSHSMEEAVQESSGGSTEEAPSMSRSSSDSSLHGQFEDELDALGDSAAFERTTGLLEDTRIAILQLIDWSCDTCLSVWHSIFAVLVGFSVFSVFSLSVILAPFRMVREVYRWVTTLLAQIYSVISSALLSPSTTITPGIDRRTKEEVVTEAGYPYSSFEVTTADGYILQLERLPNPGSRKVLYFQHGIIDNSYTWVAGGAHRSVAMMAFDRGYDVFLGNFRGNEPVQHADPHIKKKDYWNFNVNHHGRVSSCAWLASG